MTISRGRSGGVGSEDARRRQSWPFFADVLRAGSAKRAPPPFGMRKVDRTLVRVASRKVRSPFLVLTGSRSVDWPIVSRVSIEMYLPSPTRIGRQSSTETSSMPVATTGSFPWRPSTVADSSMRIAWSRCPAVPLHCITRAAGDFFALAS